MRLISWLSRVLRGTVLLVRQWGHMVVRGQRTVHIILTGPDDEGATALSAVLTDAWGVPPSAVIHGPARNTASLSAPVLLSVDPNALTALETTLRILRPFRRIHVVAIVADPRVLVSDRSSEYPDEWSQGFDYRLVSAPSGTPSLTDPGIIDRFDSLRVWMRKDPGRVQVISRKKLVHTPDDVVTSLQHFLPRRKVAPSRTLNEVIPAAELDLTWNSSSSKSDRVSRQISLTAELDRVIQEWDFDPGIPSRHPQIQGGTIIAFHTPDEVYRAEAARLVRSLERLGLRYRIVEVEPESSWVRTTLLKPRWILPLREELSGPLLYIDVDAFVHHDPWPYLNLYDGDLAATVDPDGEIFSGTIWINDTEGAREVLRRWAELGDVWRERDSGTLEHRGDHGDQAVLQEVIEHGMAETPRPFRFQALPFNLTHIFDRLPVYSYGPVIIEHLQASRVGSTKAKRIARREARLAELERETD